MKKTLVTLAALAMASVASAATTTTTYSPFSQDWTLAHGRYNADLTLDKENGAMALGVGWGQGTATQNITAITLSQPEDSMTVSFTLNLASSNICATVALRDTTTNKTVYFGNGGYEGNPGSQYGIGTLTPDNVITQYTMEAAGGTVVELTEGVATRTYTATIAWDATASRFEMSVSDGAKTVSDIAVGSTFTVDQLYISGDGGSSSDYISNFSIVSTKAVPDAPGVPEPTTATLSLLALAGLAARRRRK